MEIRHLRYFCSVAEHRSFSGAAAKLRVAQPSLSRQVRDLEVELGVELFIRSSSGVRLTDAGEAFYTHASKLLAQLAIAVSAAQEVGRGKGGDFNIGADWRLPIDAVPQAVMRIRGLFPQVQVRLREIPLHEQLAALRDRRIHVGFLPLVYASGGDDIELVKVTSMEMSAILPRGHRLAAARSLRIADLRDDTWIILDEKNAPGTRQLFEQRFRLEQIWPAIAPAASTRNGIIARVSAGEGVSVMPGAGSGTLSNPHVAIVPMDMDPFELHAAWPAVGASPLVRPFVEILLELMKGTPALPARAPAGS